MDDAALQETREILEDAGIDPERIDWYLMTPAERWAISEQLFQHYLEMGGSLDPEHDSQSPFFDPEEPDPVPVDGRPGVRLIRRGGV